MMPTPRALPSTPAAPRLGALLALVILVSLGAMALWIAIAGPRVSGGLPWLPDLWNQRLGRTVFGFGGIVCCSLAMLAWRDVRGGGR